MADRTYVDRAAIVIARMQPHPDARCSDRFWAELKSHIRIALDTEVEAGGPYLNNGWNKPNG